MTTHVVTVDEKLNTISVVRCGCGMEKSFENGQDARHYGERHVRKNEKAALVVCHDGVTVSADRKRTLKHNTDSGMISFHYNYGGSFDGRYA